MAAALLAARYTAADLAPRSTPVRLARAFFRLFNFGSVAIVFYICFALALTRWAPGLYVQEFWPWASQSVVFLRQTLISGMLALAAIALVQAFAAHLEWSARQTIAVGIIAIVVASALGAIVRLIVFGVPWTQLPSRWPWAITIVGLWSLVGGLGFVLAHYVRVEADARRRLTDAACDRETLDAQVVQARLSALQAQIEPHFLFNTLANVKRLYATAPLRGREMLTSLIDYLRAALPSMRQSGSTVKRELELARAYLTILQMRMGERLRFAIDADAGIEDAEVPPLVLGTLIENAIKHGLSPLPEGGSIRICARREGAAMRLEVRDDGRGFTEEGGCGVGLANIRSRLAALYGSAAAMTLDANTPRGVIATVSLPLRGLARDEP